MATGIIQSATDPAAIPGTLNETPKPATGVATYAPTKLPDPKTWTVTPDQTVAGQITSLTDPNSPLIQQARSRADQSMASRGLINSSIAATAADSAAYDVALPIAQADAATASKVAGYNADQKNQFAVKDQDTATTVGLNNSAALNQRSIADINTATQLKIKEMDQAQQSQLSAEENKNRALIQNSQVASSAYSTYANTLYNNSVNTNMDANARFQADQNAFNIYQQQISLAAVLAGVPDVSSQLVFTGVAPAAPVAPAPTTGAPALPLNPGGSGGYSPYESGVQGQG